MAEAKSEVLLKLKVDTSQVKKEVKKTVHIERTERIKAEKKSIGGGSGRSGMSGLSGTTTGKGLMKAGGAGLAIGAMIAKISDSIMSRRNEFNRSVMSSQSLANSGLISSAEHSKNIMDSNIQNQMKMWSNVPVIQEKLKQNIMGSQEYRKFQQQAGLEASAQNDAVGSAMSAYKSARMSGYEMSKEEVAKIATKNLELNREAQQAEQTLRKSMLNKDSNELNMSYNKLNKVVGDNSDWAIAQKSAQTTMEWFENQLKRLGNVIGSISGGGQ